MTLSDPGPKSRPTRQTSPPRITLLSMISQLQVLPLHRIPPGRPQLHITGQALSRKTHQNLRKPRLLAGTTLRPLATKVPSRRLLRSLHKARFLAVTMLRLPVTKFHSLTQLLPQQAHKVQRHTIRVLVHTQAMGTGQARHSRKAHRSIPRVSPWILKPHIQ